MFITFEEIYPIWNDYLWKGRQSKIESHSCMTWPGSNSHEYDQTIFDQPVYFWGLRNHTGKIIAVNSGHPTSDDDFRSRGLWVHPLYRRQGLATELLEAAIGVAERSNCKRIWTIPRVESAEVYFRAGFQQDPFHANGMEFGPNIYCSKSLNNA